MMKTGSRFAHCSICSYKQSMLVMASKYKGLSNIELSLLVERNRNRIADAKVG